MKTYAIVYFGAALITIFLTPVISRIAKAKGLVDAPGVRKVHKTPVPRVGGIVFVVSVLMLVIPALFLDNIIGEAFREVQSQLIVLLAAGVFIFIIGLIDDIRSVPALVKLLCLLGAGLGISLSGARIETIEVGDWFTINLGWVAWPLTLAWIAGVTVGMNFIDGLDGLAAGIAAIVCGTIAIFAYYSGQFAMFVLLLALLGSLTGFLFFNFNPAKIFMGDGGSMFIGFMIGAGSVVCQAKSATLVGIALPALALGVPILDTLLTMVRRTILDRRSIFAGERGHIHHRLLDMGLRQRTVVFLIYSVTLLAAGMGILMLTTRQGAQIMVLVGGILVILVAFSFSRTIRMRETMTALKRRRATAREIKEEQGVFDDAQLRVREADSFDVWWGAVCFMAEKLNFECLVLSWRNVDSITNTMIWRRSSEELRPNDMLCLTMPVRNGKVGVNLQIEAFARVAVSIESTGRRSMLLGRLLDEQAVPAEPRLSRQPEHEFAMQPSINAKREFAPGGAFYRESGYQQDMHIRRLPLANLNDGGRADT